MTARRAFTLIELTVVLGIVAILATVLVPVFTQPYIRERRAEVATEMAAIEEAVRGRPENGVLGYLNTVGTLPSTAGTPVVDLLVKPAGVNGPPLSGSVPLVSAGGMPIGWNGPYLRSPTMGPLYDPWGMPYTFITTASGTGAAQVNWRIHSNGPDRLPNTGDDFDYPGAGIGGNPGASYQAYVEALKLTVVRSNGPAYAPVPSGTTVNLIVADGQGGVRTIAGATGADGIASFTLTSTNNRIPIGRIGVTVVVPDGTYERQITALRPMAVATVMIPTPGPADPTKKFINAGFCQVPAGAGSGRVELSCAAGNPNMLGLPDQLYDIAFVGTWRTSDATKPCYAALTWGPAYPADDLGNRTLANMSTDNDVARFNPLVTASTVPTSISLRRTIQPGGSTTVQPRLVLQVAAPATCFIDSGGLSLRSWKP